MRNTVPILAALLALCACGSEGPTPAPEPQAIVRLAAVPGRPAAGYFELVVRGDRGALRSVSSPRIQRIELHETMRHGTMTAMRPLARIAVRDGETLSFRPGGRHLMIFGLDRRVAAGEEIPLIVHFERGGDETLSARIVPTGGDI